MHNILSVAIDRPLISIIAIIQMKSEFFQLLENWPYQTFFDSPIGCRMKENFKKIQIKPKKKI